MSLQGEYEDDRGNRIVFPLGVSDNISITFSGKNNLISVARDVSITKLCLIMGNNGYCEIGKGTSFVDAQITISDASVVIGEECMFSWDVEIRTNDGHHIFDRRSGQRINAPRNISIGNHVWIGQDALLLHGFSIGDGSVVGAKTVTSSHFKDHVIVAGNPGRVIKEDIVWSRDSEMFFNKDGFRDAIDVWEKKYFY